MKILPTPAAWQVDLEPYWTYLRAAKRSPETIKLRRYHLRHFAGASSKAPRDVLESDLTDYLGGHDWSANTIRSRRQTLVGFYTWMLHTDRVPVNPTRMLAAVAAAPGVPRPADEEDVREGTALQDERTRLMVRLAAQAGLRCREIARVWPERDLRRDLDGWSLVVHGKGDRERVVPLTRSLAAELDALPAGYAFPGRIDGHLSPGYVSKLVSSALREGVTAHRMRHRFASRAYVGTGRDIRAVQELLGHASVATTQIYTAVPSEAKRLGVEAAA